MRSAALILLLFVAVPASAQDFAATARVTGRRIVAAHGEDPTAAGTSLDLSDRVTVPRSLGDVVREAPGARVQNTGALGAFSSVSLRGADGEEAFVVLDEIPLVTPDGGAFDLGLFPPELFERIDVFRGGAPVWLGSGAIGGVLRLVPRRSELRAASVQAGGGSWGQWQLHGGATRRGRSGLAVSAQAVLRGARNDYWYEDDKGTRFDPADDEVRRRENAQLTDASALLDVQTGLGRGRLHLLTLAHERTGGFPGPGASPTPSVHRQSARGLSAASYERRHAGALRGRSQLLASAAYDLERYTDLFAEFGKSVPSATDDRAYRLFLRASEQRKLVRWLEATALGTYAFDRQKREDRLAFPQPAPSTRHTFALAAELAARGSLGSVLFELRPSARLEWSGTTLRADQGVTGPFDGTRRVLAPTARAGFAVEPVAGIAFSGSVATGKRLPSMLELFGDRGLVLPAPGLKPVSSTTYDGGVTLRGTLGPVRGTLEAHGFHQERRDAIVAQRTSQYQVAYANSPAVQQRGVELGATLLASDLFAVRGSATYLRTETSLDKRLPFRPTWVVYARPELTVKLPSRNARSLSAASELWMRSFVYADRPNLALVAGCFTTAVTASITFWGDAMRLSGRVDDVADVRCSDLVGYPLPGRSYFVSLSFRERADA